jgi:hypothetical protein
MPDQPPPVLPEASSPVPPPVPAPWPYPPEAAPVQALEYTLPSRGGRPGVLTAIGVLSIILASLSGLYSLLAGFYGFGFYMMTMASTRAMTAMTTATAGPTTTMAAAGMQPSEREAVIQRLTKDDPLMPGRRRHLDAILASVGHKLGMEKIVERGTSPITPGGEAGPDYFVTPRGRLEVFDDRAAFFFVDGSPTVRISAPPESSGDGAQATGPAVSPGGLTQSEIQAVVQQADTQVKATGSSAKGLSPQQVSTLKSLLSMPGQQLVAPGTSQVAVIDGYADPNGQVSIDFNSGSALMLGTQGNIISQSSPPPAAAFNAAAGASISLSPWAVAGFIATSVLSIGLAVLLLVAGIMVLRDSPSGRRLHLIYACLKIPLAVAAGASFAYCIYELMSSLAASTGAPAQVGFGPTTWVTVPAALSCIYPVALLIALNSRSVRAYYQSASAE